MLPHDANKLHSAMLMHLPKFQNVPIKFSVYSVANNYVRDVYDCVVNINDIDWNNIKFCIGASSVNVGKADGIEEATGS